jgi:hypothetical protein
VENQESALSHFGREAETGQDSNDDMQDMLDSRIPRRGLSECNSIFWVVTAYSSERD